MNNKEKYWLVKESNSLGQLGNAMAQPLVSAAGGMWNKFAPQGAKDWAQGAAQKSLYGASQSGDNWNSDAAAKWRANPSAGMDETTDVPMSVESFTNTNNEEVVEDRTAVRQPGTAQSPWQQALGSFARTGNAPTQTHATGTPVWQNSVSGTNARGAQDNFTARDTSASGTSTPNFNLSSGGMATGGNLDTNGLSGLTTSGQIGSGSILPPIGQEGQATNLRSGQYNSNTSPISGSQLGESTKGQQWLSDAGL